MAVAVQILLLGTIIQGAGRSRKFILDEAADFCLISRWTGEERKPLWNSSWEREASYSISKLDVSHSGQYQEQCWSRGNVTHERNSTLLVCDDRKMREQTVFFVVGQTVELTCDGMGPNQSVQWAFEYKNQTTGNWELALIDDETPSVHQLRLVKNTSSLFVTFVGPPDDFLYYCLEKNLHWCDILKYYFVNVVTDFIQRWVGESLELNCPDISGNHVWRLYNSVRDDEEESHNYTLMFPSLTLNHTGHYTCDHNAHNDGHYLLLVCPRSDPPAVAFFTGGENITLHCGDWNHHADIFWFKKSNGTEGRVLFVDHYGQKDKIYLSDRNLVILNMSLEHSGEFWCVIMINHHCAFTSKTLVVFGEPAVDHYLVRSALVSVVIMMMCVVAAMMTVRRSRSREQLAGPVDELEMSNLRVTRCEDGPCE